MAGANKQTTRKRKVYHSDSKSCSSESRQTTNQEPSTKSTSQKSPVTMNATSENIANKPHAAQNPDKASLTIVSQHKPKNYISTILHVSESPLDKNCVVKPASNADVTVDGPIRSTRGLLEPPVDRRILNSEGSAPPQSVSTLRHPLPPRPPLSNENFIAFGWNAYPTRATQNEVCRLFLRGACRSGRTCPRIHPRSRRPPGNLFIKIKLAESPRAPVYETSNSERCGAPDPPHSIHLDPVIVKLPRGPIPSRASLSQEGTNQHTTDRSSSNTERGCGAVPKGSALNDRFNERAPLNRPLVSKHSGQYQAETTLQSDSDQSSKSSVSDSVWPTPESTICTCKFTLLTRQTFHQG
ncbi:hypothetical protein BDZ94DRAFT_312023 [Collybia nuda]|uniref:C3H1-type domain-containing protein n=1 Tax=Collybia nuda TaxID=64659 RepID=A0A9P5XTS0_9AGAR|nr:hypothetical protein BDZ94DRAFT_312023 [Collybia nuda]